jgi:hypothetical protein
VQLFFVYKHYSITTAEFFEDTPENLKCCKTLDTATMSKLIGVPGTVTKHVNSGVQDLIDSAKSKDEYALLAPQNTKYKDENVRKEYKHIDYLLEKLKSYDENVYNKLVPNYSKDQLTAMKKEDDELMKEQMPPPCDGGEPENIN